MGTDMLELLTIVTDALSACGSFNSVSVREDSASAMLGREPLAAVQYGGMTTIIDGRANIELHTIEIFIKLLSIGRMDTAPLNDCIKALNGTGAENTECAVSSTDSRTVTFLVKTKYRRIPQ